MRPICICALAMGIFSTAAFAQTAPVFTSQPSNVSTADGGSFTVNVQVTTSNFSPVTWKVNFGSKTLNASASSSAQTNNLITASVAFGPVASGDAGAFQIVATNDYGSTSSAQRTLTVTPAPPTISTQPSTQTVLAGTIATFTVVAAGSPPLTYQWNKGSTVIPGATGASLSITSAQPADAGSYTCIVTNSSGFTVSSAAVLTVNASPTISISPQTIVVAAGYGATFTANANSSTTPAYRWSKDGLVIPGATGSTLSLGPQLSDQGSYTVTVTNATGSTTSAASTLTVIPSLVVKTVAGSGISGNADGAARSAAFSAIYGLAVDANGTIYVADAYNSTIRKITTAGVSTIAGLAGNTGSADGQGSSARFYNPWGIAVDSVGNLYVADAYNFTIRKITPSGAVSTFAGLAGVQGSADGQGNAARFYYPIGITIDPAGNLFVSDSYNFTIRKITSTGVVTTIAGLAGTSGNTDGVGSAARFNYPRGLGLDSAGNVYVADSNNNAVRKITPQGAVTTFAAIPGVRDNTSVPNGLAVDSSGNVFTIEGGNPVIRRITPAGVNTIVAGLSDRAGNTDGTGIDARFNLNGGAIAMDGAGNVYVADTFNYVIRACLVGGAQIQSQPAGQSAAEGSAVTFSVSPSGNAPFSYQWTFNGTPIPGATRATFTINTVQGSNAGAYSVSVANAISAVTSIAATLTVTAAAPTITLSPQSQTVNAGSPLTLTIAAKGTAPLSYQWRKDGAAIIGATGPIFIVNSVQVVDAGSYTVVVTNLAGFTTTSAALVAVNPPPDPGRLINLSILTPLTSGETMTMGAVLGGASTGGTKALLVRAGGPSLAAFNVIGVLPDPTVTLNSTSVSPAVVVGTNNDWGGSAVLSNAFTQVGAFPYASGTSKDAALFQNGTTALAAGSYTVLVSDAGSGSGTVLAELYDATPGSAFITTTPRLINVSVLKQIVARSSLTVGFVVGGSTSEKVLVRAVGPTLGLPPFNISGVMANPKIELLNNSTGQSLSVNTGWGGSATLTSAFTAVGAFQLANTSTKDSALLSTLPPGQYSARVSGADGGGGTVIVELYEVP